MRRIFAAAMVPLLLAIGMASAPDAAAATVGQSATPPNGYFVAGPGCPNNDAVSTGASGTWTRVSGGDYSGNVVYGTPNDPSYGTCTNTTAYTLTTSSQTAQFRWHFYNVYSGYYNHASVCSVYAYMPTVDAGDHNARYDFWADDNNGHVVWEAWPGKTFNQETMSGWYYIGAANVPGGYPTFTVSLSNADSAYPGWDAGAGAIAVNCAWSA